MTDTITDTTSIDASQLRQLIHEDPEIRILDVRSGSEFEGGHITGSYNIPLDTLGDHVKKVALVAHPLVLVCQSGVRASDAHGKLSAAGKDSLMVLDGGMAAWSTGGGDVEGEANGRWAMDRQVRGVAGALVLAGVLASTVVPNAKWMSAGVGGGLLYSAVSNTCAMAKMLGKLPYNNSEPCDIDAVLAKIS